MTRRQLPYKEGDCFCLPLRGGGFGRGVVARIDGKGIVFAYLLGPRLERADQAVLDGSIQPRNAALMARVGDLGLLEGHWPIVGHLEPWDPSEWRLPPFLHVDEGATHGFLRHYDDSLRFVKEERVDLAEVAKGALPRDALLGYGAAEIRLTKLLS